MPKVSDRFTAYPLRTTLDASGNGSIGFQAVGNNIRITNLSVAVSTQIAQAKATTYKGQIGDSFRISGTNSGSTGDNAPAAIDLLDGETLYVVWTGGDPSAIATATFSGYVLPFKATPADGIATWTNPIAAGDGNLIYPALKSPDYEPGVSGWVIYRDGSAEFNNMIVRGNFHVDGPGENAINLYVKNINGVLTPIIEFVLDDPRIAPAAIYAYLDVTGAPTPYYTSGVLIIDGPKRIANPQPTPARIFLRSEDVINTTDTLQHIELLADEVTIAKKDASGNNIPSGSAFSVYGQVAIRGHIDFEDTAYFDVGLTSRGITSTDDTTIQANLGVQGNLDVDGDLTIGPDSYSLGRGGQVAFGGSSSDSAAVGATETVVLTCASRVFRANRAYKVFVEGAVSVTGAVGAPYFTVRKTNAAGARVLGLGAVWCGTTGGTYNVCMSGIFVTGAVDVTAVLVLTMFGSATVSATMVCPTGNVRTIKVYDIGPASQYGGHMILS